MSFLKEILLKPLPMIWGAVSGAIGVGSYFGFDSSTPLTERVLIAVVAFLIISFSGLCFIARDLYHRGRNPVAIRKVLEGTHFFQGKIILILDKSDWIEVGQLLVLVSISDDVHIPIALLSVETKTTGGYPQCTIVVPLTDRDLREYLSDRTRWRGLTAMPDIKSHYLEVNTNV